jgi:hypothetical protein
MEVGSFLTLSRGRIRFLVIIGVIVAVGASFALLATQPRKYKATGVVFLAQTLGNADAATVASTVNDFKTAITLPEVEQKVASDAGVSQSSLSNLTTAADASSQTLKLSYTAKDPQVGTNVVRVATRDALNLLFTQQQSAAEQRLAIAEKSYDAAAKALTDFQQKNNVGNVDDDIARRSDDILTLRSQIAGGDSTAASRLLLTAKQNELNNLLGLDVTYQKLSADLKRADDSRGGAENERDTIAGRLATLDTKQAVVVPTPTETSRVTTVLPALIAAVIVVIAAALAMAWGDRRRRSKSGPGGSNGPSPNVFPGSSGAGDWAGGGVPSGWDARQGQPQGATVASRSAGEPPA